MKTFRMIGMALVAVMLGFAMSSCENDDEVDPYKDYPQLIVGQWFNFTPEASMFVNYSADGTTTNIGWDKEFGWLEESGTYSLNGNEITSLMVLADGSQKELKRKIEVTTDRLVKKGVGNETGRRRGGGRTGELIAGGFSVSKRDTADVFNILFPGNVGGKTALAS